MFYKIFLDIMLWSIQIAGKKPVVLKIVYEKLQQASMPILVFKLLLFIIFKNNFYSCISFISLRVLYHLLVNSLHSWKIETRPGQKEDTGTQSVQDNSCKDSHTWEISCLLLDIALAARCSLLWSHNTNVGIPVWDEGLLISFQQMPRPPHFSWIS